MRPIEWERACSALTALVRVEFGQKYSLVEIAETWGEGITAEQIEALRVLESSLELGNYSPKGCDV